MAYEAIGEVVLHVRLHSGKLGSGHGVDRPPRRGGTGLQRDFQVVLAVRGKGVGLHLRKDVKEIMVGCWNLGVITIAAKSAAFRLAPPINPPSI